MILEEEKAFLAPWIEQAKIGGVLTVPPLHRDLEERIGHPVSPSTMYRMLARHGWRKVQPDTYHPKADPQAQDDFKKNFAIGSWKWLPLQGGIR
jgi:transposase